MRILALDPGTTETGWVLMEATTRRPVDFGKTENRALLTTLERNGFALDSDSHTVIEMVASYGMPVGAEVFETCVWIGRFAHAIDRCTGHEPGLVKRLAVKTHWCHSARANDSNISQALVDRFAPGQPNHGKGTKTQPGFFYGFRADVWQAFALAVYAADQLQGAPF